MDIHGIYHTFPPTRTDRPENPFPAWSPIFQTTTRTEHQNGNAKKKKNWVQSRPEPERKISFRLEPEWKPRPGAGRNQNGNHEQQKKNEKSVLLEVVINRFVLEYKIPEGNQSRNQKKKVLTRTEPERKCSLNETRTDFFVSFW